MFDLKTITGCLYFVIVSVLGALSMGAALPVRRIHVTLLPLNIAAIQKKWRCPDIVKPPTPASRANV